MNFGKGVVENPRLEGLRPGERILTILVSLGVRVFVVRLKVLAVEGWPGSPAIAKIKVLAESSVEQY